MNINEFIRKKRLEYQMLQVELSDKIGLDVSAISKIESGSRAVSFNEVVSIANALGYKASEFVKDFEK